VTLQDTAVIDWSQPTIKSKTVIVEQPKTTPPKWVTLFAVSRIAGLCEIWGGDVSKKWCREHDRGKGECSVLSLNSPDPADEELSHCVPLHTHTPPEASFAGIPIADIKCCRLPIFLRSLFPTVLSFLAVYWWSSPALAFPTTFLLFFGLRWETLSHTLLFHPFCLSSVRENPPHCLLLTCQTITSGFTLQKENNNLA